MKLSDVKLDNRLEWRKCSQSGVLRAWKRDPHELLPFDVWLQVCLSQAIYNHTDYHCPSSESWEFRESREYFMGTVATLRCVEISSECLWPLEQLIIIGQQIYGEPANEFCFCADVLANIRYQRLT